MNYSKIYYDLIKKHKSISSHTGYVENHHIVPRCIGGNDDPSNIVTLPSRDHYMAHLLLIKMYPKNTELLYAINTMMLRNCYQSKRVFRFNSHLFKLLKEKQYDNHRLLLTNKFQIHNISTGKVKWSLDGSIPDGWKYGTNKKNTLGKIRYYNSETDVEIMLDTHVQPPKNFALGRRPANFIFDKNGNKKSNNSDIIPINWYIRCPKKIKIVNILTGEVDIIYDVDDIPNGFIKSHFTNNRNICCTHIITGNVATLTAEEYLKNWKWFRTNIYNNGIDKVYMTDFGIVRDNKHYYELSGINLNFSKHIDNKNSILTPWLISRSKLPVQWANCTFGDLGFYLIPKSKFSNYF